SILSFRPLTRDPLRPTLFPYTTLFRSSADSPSYCPQHDLASRISSLSLPGIWPHHRECFQPTELSLRLKPRTTTVPNIGGHTGEVVNHLLALQNPLNSSRLLDESDLSPGHPYPLTSFAGINFPSMPSPTLCGLSWLGMLSPSTWKRDPS